VTNLVNTTGIKATSRAAKPMIMNGPPHTRHRGRERWPRQRSWRLWLAWRG
jgi:hypothetical protein